MAVIRGGSVLPHVQAFADEAERRFGIDSFGTYPSHQPTIDRAVDCFGTRPEMLALAQWCTHDDVIDRYGIDYVIHDNDPGDHDPGEIWNREIARRWREMADRGSPTANHYDHVHVSFEATAGGDFATEPQEDDLTPDENAALNRIDIRTNNVQEAVHLLQIDVASVKAALKAGAAGAPIDVDDIAAKVAAELAERLKQ